MDYHRYHFDSIAPMHYCDFSTHQWNFVHLTDFQVLVPHFIGLSVLRIRITSESRATCKSTAAAVSTQENYTKRVWIRIRTSHAPQGNQLESVCEGNLRPHSSTQPMPFPDFLFMICRPISLDLICHFASFDLQLRHCHHHRCCPPGRRVQAINGFIIWNYVMLLKKD